MNFTDGQTIINEGEHGSWCGILLKGDLSLILPQSPVNISLPLGSFVGEMAVWQPGSVRSATIKGASEGLIATILVRMSLSALQHRPQPAPSMLQSQLRRCEFDASLLDKRAPMQVHDLREFVIDNPEVGGKLMHRLGKVALGKQVCAPLLHRVCCSRIAPHSMQHL